MSDDNAARRAPVLIEIAEVLPTNTAALRSLFQLYEYDFSDIEGAVVADDGRFHHLDNVEFDHGYFIRADGALAGFALVNREPSRAVDGEEVWWMEEFFVMRRYRRVSLGRRAAHLVIERHPGIWEVTETPNNSVAIAFWRRVLAAYSYEEIEFNDAKWGARPLQRFTSR